MTSISKVINLIEHHTGIRGSSVANVARRLREAGLLPAGGPGQSPQLDQNDVLRLLVGVSAGAKLDDVATATRTTLACVPGGADVTGAPLSIPRTAEIALQVLAGMAFDGSKLDGVTVLISIHDPDVVIAWADGVRQRFLPLGSNPETPAAPLSVRVDGEAFAAIMKGLK